MRKKIDVSIVIPTYNEKENILKIVPAINKELQKVDFNYEILVVDDDSRDKTGEIARKKFEKQDRVRVFIRKKDKGLANAIKKGIKEARGEVVIGMDADFNHDPKVLPELLSKVKDADLVVASRFIKGGGMDDKFRYLSTLTFNFFLRFFFGFPTTDNASGYYAIPKSSLKRLGLDSIYYGYGDYHLRLVYFCKKAGLKIVETPVYYKKRTYGQSKSNLTRMAFEYLKEAFRLKYLVDYEENFAKKERNSQI